MSLLAVSGDVDATLNHIDNPDKKFGDHRDYSADNKRFDRVSNFYRTQHINQTFEFAKKQQAHFGRLDKKEMTIFEALSMLDEIVDESDPDADFAQIIHALQTGEACRKKYPNPEFDWFWCTGFIHDLGKILAHPKFGSQPQWCVVGDTFPVGCAYSDKCVYPDTFAENPDFRHPVYSTKLGVYKQNCGLDNVTMSYGHDEYLYQVCVGNKCLLPEEALYVIRYHSFYPWHSGNAYTHLTNEKDQRMLRWVKEFQQCDLYSKSDKAEDLPDVKTLKPMYEALCAKYFPTITLRW